MLLPVVASRRPSYGIPVASALQLTKARPPVPEGSARGSYNRERYDRCNDHIAGDVDDGEEERRRRRRRRRRRMTALVNLLHGARQERPNFNAKLAGLGRGAEGGLYLVPSVRLRRCLSLCLSVCLSAALSLSLFGAVCISRI